MMRETYRAQVDLLVRALRVVAPEKHFALKGGTAINLFQRNLPRLSVDIDLVWLPSENYQEASRNIAAAFARLESALEAGLPGARVRVVHRQNDRRLLVRQRNAEIKIETSPVMRGTVHEPSLMRLVPQAEETFGFAEMQVVSFLDLYAGKFVASLDRQHPRDLFDVHEFYRYESMNEELFRTFLVYVASSNRPPHELLNPTRLTVKEAFYAEFAGMTTEAVPLTDLLAARERLIQDVQRRLEGPAAEFLLTLHDGHPNFGVIGLAQAAKLPAVKWKIRNLNKLIAEDPEKHSQQREAIQALIKSIP